MTIIYLVRHGTTDLVGKMLCGTTPGISLNDEGRHQAERTAHYLAQIPIKALYCSPIQRAVETAGIIGRQLGLSAVQKEYLTEINFGDLQGTQASILRELPLWKHFIQHPSDVTFPNGDNVAEVQKRAASGLEELVQQFAEHDEIVCVAHGEVLLLVIAYAIGLPLDELHHLSIDTASVTKIEWSAERKKLRYLNFQPI